jgi:hypothetical protein
MRQRLTPTVLGLSIVLSAGAIPAAAQVAGVPGAYRGPIGLGGVASPAYPSYLNLLRAGNPLFANYYGLVRPELTWRQSVQNLQLQTTSNQQSITTLETQGIPGTGHGTMFLNTSHYFYNRGTASPGQAFPGRTTTAQQQPAQLQQPQRYQAQPSRRQ